MNTVEQPGERSLEQAMQRLYIAASKTICISDLLNFIIHAIY